MKKIIKAYVFTTISVLCVALLVCGIINVSGETSYILSGERDEYLTAESSKTQRLLVENGGESEGKEVLILTDEQLAVMSTAAEIVLPSPVSNILWAVSK